MSAFSIRRYPAVVRDVADPEQRGRILVRCQELVAGEGNYPFWIEPSFPLAGTDCGWFFLPVVDDIVQLEITNAGNDPVYGDSNFRWLCCDYSDGPDLPSEFIAQGKYGKRFGIKMPSGQLLMFDEGVTEIILKYGKLRLGGEGADENLVLGKVFQACLSAFMQAFLDHFHTGWFGETTTPDPASAAAVTILKASPVDDSAILSDVAFTQKGGL